MIGQLQGDYFIDPTSGLAFKLNMVIMGKSPWGNDLKKIGEEVLRVGGLCKSEARQCLPTLGFVESQWTAAQNTNASFAEMLGQQTRCFVFLSKEYSEDYLKEYKIPWGYPEMSFIWNGRDTSVYTPYNTNNLGDRYKAFQSSLIPTPPTGGATGGGTSGGTSGGGTNVNLNFNELDLDLTLTMTGGSYHLTGSIKRK
jgi:hypothetical protein